MTHGTRPRSSKATARPAGSGRWESSPGERGLPPDGGSDWEASIGGGSLGRRRDREVPAERAPARPLPPHHAEQRRQRPRRQARDRALEGERVAESRRVAAGKGAVPGERLLAGALAGED